MPTLPSPALPTIALDVLAGAAAAPGVFVLDRRIDDPAASFGHPYRSDYYGVGLCVRGHAALRIDLEDAVLGPGKVLAMPPETVKQWRGMSADFEHVVVFFTKPWLAGRGAPDPARLALFERGRPLLALPETAVAAVHDSLLQVHRTFVEARLFRDEILRARIAALLYELEAIGQSQAPAAPVLPGRGRRLAEDFKRLVSRHVLAERQVAFYAQALHVTVRHLSSTLREHTGRTAGDWIQEAVVLEACVMLLDPSLPVATVADTLRFPDPSTFGKYFKRRTGRSPREYRDALNAARPTS